MDRRRYLALSAMISSTLAGCASVQSETALPAEEEHERRRALLQFQESDEDVFTIQLAKLSLDERTREYYPFRISTWQQDGLHLSSLRLEFRSPPYSIGFSSAGISLQEKSHAGNANISQDNEDPSTTVVEMTDLDFIGATTVSLHFLLSGDQGQDPQTLWMGVEAALSADSILQTDYRATGDTTVEFP